MIKPTLKDDAFLSDVAYARHANDGLHLWWLGQSGYLIQWLGRHILVDPYLSDSLTEKYAASDRPHDRMSERVIDPVRLVFIDLVTASHVHTDHLDGGTLIPLQRGNFDLRLLAPRAILREAEQRFAGELDFPMDDGTVAHLDEIAIHAVPAAHDRIERDEFGCMRCLGYVFEFGGLAIYHSGDTVRNDDVVERLRRFDIDLALLPINGKLGNLSGVECARFAKEIGAKLVIPCHYDMFEFNTADPREQFIPECERIGQPYRVLKLGERFTLNSQNPPGR